MKYYDNKYDGIFLSNGPGDPTSSNLVTRTTKNHL